MKRTKLVEAALIATCTLALLAAAASAQIKAVDEKGNPAGTPNLLKKVNPAYPPEAKKEKIEGSVVLEIRIDEKGKVTEATATKSPDERLSKSAIDAVKQWEFEPTRIDGKPVKVKATVTVNFRLK